MKSNEQVIGTAVRIEWEEATGKLFLVFEIIDEKQKQEIKKTWTQNTEYRLIEKNLVMKDGE